MDFATLLVSMVTPETFLYVGVVAQGYFQMIVDHYVQPVLALRLMQQMIQFWEQQLLIKPKLNLVTLVLKS